MKSRVKITKILSLLGPLAAMGCAKNNADSAAQSASSDSNFESLVCDAGTSIDLPPK